MVLVRVGVTVHLSVREMAATPKPSPKPLVGLWGSGIHHRSGVVTSWLIVVDLHAVLYARCVASGERPGSGLDKHIIEGYTDEVGAGSVDVITPGVSKEC